MNEKLKIGDFVFVTYKKSIRGEVKILNRGRVMIVQLTGEPYWANYHELTKM